MTRTRTTLATALAALATIVGCNDGDSTSWTSNAVTCHMDEDGEMVCGPPPGGPDAGAVPVQDATSTSDADAVALVDAPTHDADDTNPTPECFGDLLTVAEELENQLYAQILPECSDAALTDTVTSETAAVAADADDDDDDGSYGGGGDGEAPSDEDEAVVDGTEAPKNCGYTDDQIASHDDAVAALSDFQTWFHDQLETTSQIYAGGQTYDTAALLSCLVLLNGGPDDPPPPPPAPVCTPANTEYNCKAAVVGKVYSYWNAHTNYPFAQDTARGTTCTDPLWAMGFFWTRMLYAPWNHNDRKGQILTRAWAARSNGLASWETHTSCLRETDQVRTKYRLMLQPKATIVPRWVWDPRNNSWRENNENFGSFWNQNNEQCAADCLANGETARQFKIGASVRPKLTAPFGGFTKSEQIPDGYWDWGNNTIDYRAEVRGKLHCFGPGTLYTAQDTFTTVPSDQELPFDALIAPDCTVTDNVGVNGSVSYTQQGQQGSFTLGLGAQASQQTACRRDAGSEIRLSISCNMAEGAGFANFRTAAIDMPAHGNACVTNGRCAMYSMMVGGATPADKLDLGYWFEDLASIARAAPSDGRNWAHLRRGYSMFRRGTWQYDVNNPDWPGSWTNHRHAWEGNACRLYKITNPATGAMEAMSEDKAICAFHGQRLVDPPGAPGAPQQVQPTVMLWPYDNEHAQWDPELGRPTTAQCTQNSECLSGNCVGGRCQ